MRTSQTAADTEPEVCGPARLETGRNRGRSHGVRYAGRHGERAVAPVIAISLGGLGRGLRPRQVLMAIGRVRAFGEYIRSVQDADDPAARTARIRAEMAGLLTLPGLDIPATAMDPYLDFIAAKIALDITPATAGQA